MSFTPRLDDTGIRGNPYWYADNPFYQSGYGMPNCTAYAWGRFWEEAPSGGPPRLSLGNGADWFGYTQDGYPRSQTPQVGAVICFGGGSSGFPEGHVAVVEEINADGSIVTSNSGWQSTFFWTELCRPPNYNTLGYDFQGFILNPNVTPGPGPGGNTTPWLLYEMARRKREAYNGTSILRVNKYT